MDIQLRNDNDNDDNTNNVIDTDFRAIAKQTVSRSHGSRESNARQLIGRGMIRLATLIELKFSIRVLRAYPLIEVRQTVPCRAIRGNSISINSNYLPPLLAEFRLRGYPRVQGARVSDRTRWSPQGEFFLRPRRTIARGPSLSDCQKPNETIIQTL